MVKKGEPVVAPEVKQLEGLLDSQMGRYKALRGVSSFGAYVGSSSSGADEETLTEPLLSGILEEVLGFPRDAYFPQLGKGGMKPDFTPIDLIAHPFVLDAKSSDENLGNHEPQIRRYMTQRSLDYGVLFNLHELRGYRTGKHGHDPSLSFQLLPLWKVARGEAMPAAEATAFEAFCSRFRFRRLDVAQKIDFVRQQQPWAVRLAADAPITVDVEFLVERLRLLSRELVDDASAQPDSLEVFLAMNPARRKRLLDELHVLALDIEPGHDLTDLPADLESWRSGTGLLERVWRQYLLRVAYLALARILLYRAWEDVGFVDDYLYDGGFGIAYERLSNSVGRVLDEAFLHGAEQYQWLYGRDNNYDWYRPRDPALVEVLYSLAPVPLGKLDADVLGALYVSYVDEIDRDRLGQFFTPRPVVKFMLDRAGFKGRDGVFRIEGDERKPLRLLDFATGSGGFLVEAARRVIDGGGVDEEDPRALREALAAIVTGFVGGEISPFPYYLTEVNLLLQVSRLLGRLRLATQHRQPPFALGVLHVDTLTSKSQPAASLENLEAALRADHAELRQSEAFDLVPLDGEKLETYRRLKEDGGFDLVIGNPPYVAEANNKLLFDRLKAIGAWKGIYKGKTDYLYYFLYLAVEKLAPGGRLCVITPAGWMNASEADFLREKLASELRLDELFLFGSYRLFAADQGPAPTPTVESAILIATKTPASPGHQLRVVALEDEVAAARALTGDPAAVSPSREALLDELVRRGAARSGRRGGIHAHSVRQRTLRPETPWAVKFGERDIATRIVAHLEASLRSQSEPVEPLETSWKVLRGIETGADAYSNRIWRRLTPAQRAQLNAAGCSVGDPVYELPAGSERRAPWKSHLDLLARSPESRAILYGALDEADYTNIVRLTREQPPPPDLLALIESWKPLLASRAGFAAFPNRPWWETHRAREASDLAAPKVISLYRTDRGRFTLDEQGKWKPSNKTTIVVGRQKQAPVAYLCGLLNSELVDLWYAVRGKTPRDVWRNYEPKRMNELPYRRPEDDPRAERIARLVRELGANRRALLPLRASVRDLGRIVKDPWKPSPVDVDRSALVAELPAAETRSVRTDPELEATGGAGLLGKPTRLEPGVLTFRRARVETARVSGPADRLDLIEGTVRADTIEELLATPLPRDLRLFAQRVDERVRDTEALLAEGRRLVEEVERLVCGLFGLTDELTDAVVAHAVARAGSATAPDQ
ncbi:hypothetical protein BH18ACT13_BH18ACT13_08090 [soil metagenome]